MKKIQAEKEKTGERYDKLRKKNHELDQQLKKKETLIRQMKGVQTSLEILQRMTVYTRTREIMKESSSALHQNRRKC